MPGGYAEGWRPRVGIALQPSTTGIAATRKMLWREFNMEATKSSQPEAFDNGTPDNVLAHSQGAIEASGGFNFPLSADEIDEALALVVQGGVTPTTPTSGVYNRVYVPGATEQITIEQDDGARYWQGLGFTGDTIRIAGGVNTRNVVTVGLFGNDVVDLGSSALDSLTDRTPELIQGWETRFFADALGDTPGTTEMAGKVATWEINVNRNRSRLYGANNSQAAVGTPSGTLEVSGNFRMLAFGTPAKTMYDAWRANTLRLLRFHFGGNKTITSTYKKEVIVDIPCALTAVPRGNMDQNVRVYDFNWTYVRDPALGAGVKFTTQNARATLFA